MAVESCEWKRPRNPGTWQASAISRLGSAPERADAESVWVLTQGTTRHPVTRDSRTLFTKGSGKRHWKVRRSAMELIHRRRWRSSPVSGNVREIPGSGKRPRYPAWDPLLKGADAESVWVLTQGTTRHPATRDSQTLFTKGSTPRPDLGECSSIMASLSSLCPSGSGRYASSVARDRAFGWAALEPSASSGVATKSSSFTP
jgi:hypothetical protein